LLRVVAPMLVRYRLCVRASICAIGGNVDGTAPHQRGIEPPARTLPRNGRRFLAHLAHTRVKVRAAEHLIRFGAVAQRANVFGRTRLRPISRQCDMLADK
jgi:hypothetical protein